MTSDAANWKLTDWKVVKNGDVRMMSFIHQSIKTCEFEWRCKMMSELIENQLVSVFQNNIKTVKFK